MCINCGCGKPDDDMGNKDNITTEDLAKAAIASGTDGQTTLENINETLAMVTPEEVDKKIEELKSKTA